MLMPPLLPYVTIATVAATIGARYVAFRLLIRGAR